MKDYKLLLKINSDIKKVLYSSLIIEYSVDFISMAVCYLKYLRVDQIKYINSLKKIIERFKIDVVDRFKSEDYFEQQSNNKLVELELKKCIANIQLLLRILSNIYASYTDYGPSLLMLEDDEQKNYSEIFNLNDELRELLYSYNLYQKD